MSSISFSVGTDSTSNAAGIYDTENLNSLVPAANTGINMNDGLENHVIAGYYPYGYNDASTAYTSEAGKSADTKLFVKINDSTANTGGVRLYATNETASNVFAGTATATEATIDNLGSPTSNTTSNDFTYSFSADTSLTEDQDTDLSTSFNGFIDANNFTFQANQNVYLT